MFLVSFVIALLLFFTLAACTPAPDGTGVFDGPSDSNTATSTDSDGETSYWHQKYITADNVPNILKAQDLLEEDLVACGYEKRGRDHFAKMNDPVSTRDGHVVDNKGKARSKTPLPTTYSVRDCMESKGWVKLRSYYTTPY
jgi:hypothetical protein